MRKEDQLPDFVGAVENINSTRSTVKITPNLDAASRINERIKPYKHLPNTFRIALERTADYIRVVMIPRTFEREGPGWRPLARRTIAERIAQGFGGEHPILRRSGDLYRELTDRAHPRHIEIIRTGKYARIEIGGSSAKFMENQLGDNAQRLPARPMIPGTGNIPLQDRDRLMIKAILMKAIQEDLRKK